MENLFGYTNVEKKKNDHNPSAFEAPKYIQIIEPKKAQNLAILLKALNVTTEEVCEAIMEGNTFDLKYCLIKQLYYVICLAKCTYFYKV